MEKFFKTDDPIRTNIKAMEVGDLFHFPESRLSVIRTSASTLSVELMRDYSTKRNRELKTIDVVRNK